MVEVFSTNVQEVEASEMLARQLLAHFPAARVSFDLEDCDKVLRVEADHVDPELVFSLMQQRGFRCQMLE